MSATVVSSPTIKTRFASAHYTIGAVVAILPILAVLGIVAFQQLSGLNDTQLQVRRSNQTIDTLNNLLSQLKDAETGQRGYLLTGDPNFLNPYESALRELQPLLARPPAPPDVSLSQAERIQRIFKLVEAKLEELSTVLMLYKEGKSEQGLALVRAGKGRQYMDQIRGLCVEGQSIERALRDARRGQAEEQKAALRFLICLLALVAPLLVLTAVAASRHDASRNAILLKESQGRRIAEQDLKLSESLNKSILDSSADCVAVLDQGGHLLSMNAPGQRLMEIDDFAKISGRFWPDLWNANGLPVKFALAQARAGKSARFQGECVTEKGTIKWWDVVVSPLFDSDGKVEKILAIARDMTELKQAENKVRESEGKMLLLTNTMPQIVWSARPDGYHDYFNERWYEYTGMPRPTESGGESNADDGQGWRWKDYLHPDDYDRTITMWKRCLETGEPFHTEYRFKGVNGNYRWFVGRALALRDASHSVSRWFGTSTDIEDQKRVDMENRELLSRERTARSEAERAIRLKDEFVATLSHELRTPLNAILGWTQILQRKNCDQETIDKALKVIDRNCKIQTQMVEDLLDMNRIMSGKMRLEVHPLNPADIIEAVVQSVQPTADVKGVSIRPVLGSAGTIQGDPSRLQQIVWNLLTNAIKFTPKGGKITITLRKVGSHILMEFSDTGQGISPEFLPFVFDRFRQADGSTTRKYGGLGLGLSIAKNLVEMHGGTISVASGGEGTGTTFSLVFPLAAIRLAPNTEHLSAGIHSEEKQLSLPSLAHLSVLIVDDEEDSRDLVQRILEDFGASVRSFSSAAEAISFLKGDETPPDVIVSDIGMPAEDGYEFIKQVRSLETEVRDVPAAALTALARMEDRRRALLTGFQTHIAKPVDASELVAVVASLAHRTGKEALLDS